MTDQSPYSAPKANPLDDTHDHGPPRPGRLLSVGAVLAGLLHSGMAFNLGIAKGLESGEVQGMWIAMAIALPFLIVFLSQIWPGNRNWLTRTKIFFYASLVLWLNSIRKIMQLIDGIGEI